ncbi:hypothetical protein BDZ97DRAFT_1915610 [Flammula alnicola]|nr:hypothetical protein BDZ97DRAFT_1915610 [Flammula alnicola]
MSFPGMQRISTGSVKGPAEVAHRWMFIGFTVNALLLGVMTTQVYMYYAKYKKDKWWLKAIVGLFAYCIKDLRSIRCY